MAATALKSPWSSVSDRSVVPADAADVDSGPRLPRLRVAIAPDQLRAIGAAIAQGAPVEVAAQVLDSAAAQHVRHLALKPGACIVIEMVRSEHADESVRMVGSDDELPNEPLTPREREVLELVAEGMSNRAIAERLGNSEHTVKFHVGSLLGKLDAATRAELVAIAVRRGLIML